MSVSRFLPTFIVPLILAVLAGCASTPEGGRRGGPFPTHERARADQPEIYPDLPKAGSGRGGYYKDDGPGDAPPPNLSKVPDAEVRFEPYAKYANRPYVVFGKRYVPVLDQRPFVQRGHSSWYGKKFHGQKTASGEIYDMYKMTAAHPTLPIPSYARITSTDNGKQVVVRINDRGPFHAGRIVDVSYTAAVKLGLLGKGSGHVTLERLLPDAGEHLATLLRHQPEADPEPVTTVLAAPAEISQLLIESKAEGKAAKKHPEADGERADDAPAAGFYVQLGAFNKADKAAEVRARAAERNWLEGALSVVRSGALHRVLCGPFETRAAAQEAARNVPSDAGVRPIVIKR
jgi:rare lipoprotein A